MVLEADEFRRITGIIVAPSAFGFWRSAMFRLYFQTVDFDFAVRATQRDAPAAYLGFALRLDTGFAELIGVALDPMAEDAIAPCLVAAGDELRSRNALFLATKPIPGNDTSEILTAMGFRKVSEEVLLSKCI